MKVIIVEDEKAARERLINLLLETEATVEIVAVSSSVRDAVQLFQKGISAELAFFDIQLSDGLSFDIFRQCQVPIPVIFATAYDQYLLEAFHTNGIDYLLKPLKKQDLARALEKFHQLQSMFVPDFKALLQKLEGQEAYLQRVAGSKGGAIIPVSVADIAWFSTRHKVSFLRTFANEMFLVDKPLSALESLLDPSLFRRVNRQYIVNIAAVRRLRPHHKGKLLIELEPTPKEAVSVSQEQATMVRAWIEL